jgi:signal transduction histidine kinase
LLSGFLAGGGDAFTTLDFAGTAARGVPLGAQACLLIEQDKEPFAEDDLFVVRMILSRLALACQACFDHANCRILLELTRDQNREIAAVRDRSEMALRSKSEFIAAISHEVRTPLNSIIGFAEMLQFEAAGSVLTDYAKNILAGGRQLYAVFNDLLDLAKLNSDRLVLHPEDIDLAEVCAELWASHLREAQAKGLVGAMVMAPDLPARMVVDPVRLRQVLSNLLGNAIKYTDQGRVEMHVHLNDGLLAFSIWDTGPGIPDEEQRRVFERFQQADNVLTHNYKGTGLGLAIALELAECMGGLIDLSSTPGAGSTFTLLLPRVDPGLGVQE